MVAVVAEDGAPGSRLERHPCGFLAAFAGAKPESLSGLRYNLGGGDHVPVAPAKLAPLGEGDVLADVPQQLSVGKVEPQLAAITHQGNDNRFLGNVSFCHFNACWFNLK